MTSRPYQPPVARKRRAPASVRMATVGGRKVVVIDEHTEQVYLFEWAQSALRRLPALKWLHAIPNGGHRHAATAGKLKAEGVKAGVSDIFLDVPGEVVTPAGLIVVRQIFHGLRIELKAIDRRGERNGGCSPEQVKWLLHYRDAGYAVAVCYGWREAADVIESYLAGEHINRLPEFRDA